MFQIGILKRWKKRDSSKQPIVRRKENEVKVDSKPLQKSLDIKCFKCLGHKHITSKYPNKKVMTTKESQGDIESEEEAKLEKEENEYLEEEM